MEHVGVLSCCVDTEKISLVSGFFLGLLTEKIVIKVPLYRIGCYSLS